MIESKNLGIADSRAKYDKISQKLNELTNSKVQCSKDMDNYESEIRQAYTEVESLKTSKCFTCGHDLTDKTLLESLRDKSSERIKKAENSILEIKSLLSSLIPEIETSKIQVDHLNSMISTMSYELTPLMQKVNELQKVANLNKKAVPEFVDNSEHYRTEILSLESKIEGLKEQVAELETSRASISSELDILKKINYDVSRGNFRTYVLQKAVKAFNTILSHISLAIMKDSPEVLEFDGNNVEIKYKTKYYEQMSGGERNRIDIALELTKRKYKSMVTGLEFNMLVMDEVIDGLDAYGISAIFDAVEISGSCDSFLVISHRKDIELDYHRVIKVIKEDNLSRVEVM